LDEKWERYRGRKRKIELNRK